MIETISLLPGVTLRVCRDTRFKQGCLSFQLVRQMDKAEASMNALLPAVLLRGTKSCPDLRAITEHLDELYGASVSPLVRRVGDYQNTGVFCGFMDDRFALPGDKVLEPVIDFLEEVLLDSPLEEGGFLKSFVESEKKNLIATIESEMNEYCARYMAFMDECKTEREATTWAVLEAEKRGYKPFVPGMTGSPCRETGCWSLCWLSWRKCCWIPLWKKGLSCLPSWKVKRKTSSPPSNPS